MLVIMRQILLKIVSACSPTVFHVMSPAPVLSPPAMFSPQNELFFFTERFDLCGM